MMNNKNMGDGKPGGIGQTQFQDWDIMNKVVRKKK